MSESFELTDDEELALYLLIIAELGRQMAAVMNDPSAVLFDTFWTNAAASMQDAIASTLEAYTLNGVQLAITELEQIPPDLFENVRFAIQQRSGELIRNITETTRSRVIELLDRSVAEGWTTEQLTEALQDFPGSPFGETRARLIAVTETTSAYIDGAGIAAEELRNQGYIVTLIWNTVRADDVCVICRSRNNKPQGDGWTELRAAHPGCRCFITIQATKMIAS